MRSSDTTSVKVANHLRSLPRGQTFTVQDVRDAVLGSTKSSVVAVLWRLKLLGAVSDVGETRPAARGLKGRVVMQVTDLDAFQSVGGKVHSTRGGRAASNIRFSQRAQDLRAITQVLAKTTAGDGATWHLTHAATDDGLSQVDDGREHGMFPLRGEAYDTELAQRCVNYVVTHVLGREQS